MLAALSCVVFLSAGLVSAEPKPELTKQNSVDIKLTAVPIANFSRTGGSVTKFGMLEWRGGLQLTSTHPNFGGLSGIALDQDGKKFVTVSDGGAWITGELTYDGDRPAGIKNARLGPLLTTEGKNLKRGRDKDAEAIAVVAGNATNGSLLISFERNARIARYDLSPEGVSPTRGFVELPPESRKMSRNSGLEAMTVLKGGPNRGAIIAFAERFLDDKGNHTGWLWTGGKAQRLALSNEGGFDVTDVAGLSDGSIIILERRFGWLEGIHMRLRRIAAGTIKPGIVLAGETLIEASLEKEIDNMEGLGISTGRSGETVLTIVSDNNFNTFLQRTILLQFALIEPRTAKARP